MIRATEKKAVYYRSSQLPFRFSKIYDDLGERLRKYKNEKCLLSIQKYLTKDLPS